MRLAIILISALLLLSCRAAPKGTLPRPASTLEQAAALWNEMVPDRPVTPSCYRQLKVRVATADEVERFCLADPRAVCCCYHSLSRTILVQPPNDWADHELAHAFLHCAGADMDRWHQDASVWESGWLGQWRRARD